MEGGRKKATSANAEMEKKLFIAQIDALATNSVLSWSWAFGKLGCTPTTHMAKVSCTIEEAVWGVGVCVRYVNLEQLTQTLGEEGENWQTQWSQQTSTNSKIFIMLFYENFTTFLENIITRQ